MTAAALARVTALLAVGLAAAGTLLFAGRGGGWLLLRRLAWPLAVAGIGSVLATWAMTIGNTTQPAKATLWCLPGVLAAGRGAFAVHFGRRAGYRSAVTSSTRSPS